AATPREASSATTASTVKAAAKAAATPSAETATNCSGLTSSAPGITPTEVHLAMSNISLAGPVGNSTFDIRPALHAIADAVVDDINKSGGVACGRKLVIKPYDVNPIDPNDGQA